MDKNKLEKLEDILKRAEKDEKNNYSIYHNYRRCIDLLELNSNEYEKAIRQLLNVLRL